MLRSAILLASVAHVALAAVVGVCAREPYHEIQQFKHYDVARAHCHAHFPAPVYTKTVHPKCLTTTKTHVLRTETVTATRTERCPKEPTHYHHHHTPHESQSPIPTGYKHYKGERDVAPAPTADPVLKRDGGNGHKANHEIRHHQWRVFHEKMLECGYDCLRNACSCMANTKTHYHTPKPTCTSTEHKQAVATHTHIVTAKAHHCNDSPSGYGGHKSPQGYKEPPSYKEPKGYGKE